MEPKDLINFKALSQFLTGKDYSIRKDNFSKKHGPDVQKLESKIKQWMDKIESDKSE